MNYTIKAVGESDYLVLVKIWEASVRETHHFLSDKDIQYFKPLILNEYLDAVNLKCVQNEANKIVGFIGVHKNQIEMLFVHPDYFSKGIGKLLLIDAIEKSNIKKVDVNEQNEEAVRFYHYMGFQTVSRSETDASGKPFPILHLELKGER